MTAKKHLEALAAFAERRRDVLAKLDEEELELYERARAAGASWVKIGNAMGIKSRQGAEKRHKRLKDLTTDKRKKAESE